MSFSTSSVSAGLVVVYITSSVRLPINRVMTVLKQELLASGYPVEDNLIVPL